MCWNDVWVFFSSSSCSNDCAGYHCLHHLVCVLSQVQQTEGRLPPSASAPGWLWRWDPANVHGLQEVPAKPWVPGWERKRWRHFVRQQTLIFNTPTMFTSYCATLPESLREPNQQGVLNSQACLQRLPWNPSQDALYWPCEISWLFHMLNVCNLTICSQPICYLFEAKLYLFIVWKYSAHFSSHYITNSVAHINRNSAGLLNTVPCLISLSHCCLSAIAGVWRSV